MDQGVALSDVVVELVEGFSPGCDEVLLDLDRHVGAVKVVAQSVPITPELGADAGQENLYRRHRLCLLRLRFWSSAAPHSTISLAKRGGKLQLQPRFCAAPRTNQPPAPEAGKIDPVGCAKRSCEAACHVHPARFRQGF